MLAGFKKWIFAAVLITVVFLANSVMVLAYEIPKEKKFIILVDEGHKEVFGLKDFLYGFRVLNESLPIEVYSINSTIDDKVLAGVDLLIIPPLARGASFEDDEVRAISTFVENGGSLLVLASTNKSTHVSPTNILLSGLKIGEEYVGDSIQFLLIGGERVRLFDNFHNYLSPNIIGVNISDEITKEFESSFGKINGTIFVSAVALNVLNEEGFYLLKTAYTTYGVDVNNKIHFTNSSPIIGVFRKYSDSSRVAILGFAESLTNRTTINGLKWIELGANLEFFKGLISWLLRPEIFSKETIIKPMYLHFYLLISSGLMIAFGQIIYKVEELKKEKEKKKEEEIKISEILKKIREGQ